MPYSLTGISNLGNVLSEDRSKDANLFAQPLPRTDSSSSILLDLFGASKIITLTGRFTTGHGTIADFLAEFEALVDGSQTTISFESARTGATINVKVLRAAWNSTDNNPSHVDWTIEMQESSSVD